MWHLRTFQKNMAKCAALGLFVVALAGCAEDLSAPELAQVGTANHNSTAFGQSSDNVVLMWDHVMLEALRTTAIGPPMLARALAVVSTGMYDAWAAYDDVAIGTQLGGTLRQDVSERTMANKEEAISYAAYQTLVDLLPAKVALFDALMNDLGYPINPTPVPDTPAYVGITAANALIAFRHNDGSNQLGGYADNVGTYQPVNTWDQLNDIEHWQPLRFRGGSGQQIIQTFLASHWDHVIPFSLASADQFRPPPPAAFGSSEFQQQAEQVLEFSANLTDRKKVIAEYWADGPASELPPGHWQLFGQFVSQRDGHSVDDDVKMFFLLSNAVFDAGIASWEAKIFYDYVRPITAINYLFEGQWVEAWAGPGLGTQPILGERWRPYQVTTFPTPPFSEYVSGHSTFSSAAAEVLKRFTGSDDFGMTIVIPVGWSRVEPGDVPKREITLYWPTFKSAADEAGISRLYGGIHFAQGDREGRKLGTLIGESVWNKAQYYFSGGVNV